MKTFLRKHLDDICVPLGLGFLVFATFLWSTVAGFYAVGVALIAIGVLAGLGGGRQQ